MDTINNQWWVNTQYEEERVSKGIRVIEKKAHLVQKKYFIVHPSEESNNMFSLLRGEYLYSEGHNTFDYLKRNIRATPYIMAKAVEECLLQFNGNMLMDMWNNSKHGLGDLKSKDIIIEAVKSWWENLQQVIIRDARQKAFENNMASLDKSLHMYINWLATIGIVPYHSASNLQDDMVKDSHQIDRVYKRDWGYVLPPESVLIVLNEITHKIYALNLDNHKLVNIYTLSPLLPRYSKNRMRFDSLCDKLYDQTLHAVEAKLVYKFAVHENAIPFKAITCKRPIKPVEHVSAARIDADNTGAVFDDETLRLASGDNLVEKTATPFSGTLLGKISVAASMSEKEKKKINYSVSQRLLNRQLQQQLERLNKFSRRISSLRSENITIRDELERLKFGSSHTDIKPLPQIRQEQVGGDDDIVVQASVKATVENYTKEEDRVSKLWEMSVHKFFGTEQNFNYGGEKLGIMTRPYLEESLIIPFFQCVAGIKDIALMGDLPTSGGDNAMFKRVFENSFAHQYMLFIRAKELAEVNADISMLPSELRTCHKCGIGSIRNPTIDNPFS